MSHNVDENKRDAEGVPGAKRSGTRRVAAVGAVVFLAIAVAGGAYLWSLDAAARNQEQIAGSDPVVKVDEPEDDGLVDNPVDFASLKLKNPDIYAWLTIGGTNINAPVLQSTEDDNYYLDHNRWGEYNPYGSIFSQRINSTDFTDPVTLIYGHDNNVDDDMVLLNQLHKFEDEDFFEKNEKMTIVIPGHVLTYRVIAAYEYDDRHIMNSFNFSDPTVLQEYFDSVLNPTSLNAHVREGATLDASKDKIVQLSTCMLDQFHGPNRYIVTGVLIDDQPTR